MIDDEKRPLGLSVSRWQDYVDWSAAYAAGARFAFVRGSDVRGGEPCADYRYRPHFDGAVRAGLLVGVCHVLRQPDPLRQAELAARIYDLRSTLPPVVVVERVVIGGQEFDSVRDADAVAEYCRHFEAVVGIRPVIRTAAQFWNQLPGGAEVAPDYELWAVSHRRGDGFPASAEVHQWSLAGKPWRPRDWPSGSWRFWQYTSHGRLSGYDGRLDMSRFNGTLAELQAYSQWFLDGEERPFAASSSMLAAESETGANRLPVAAKLAAVGNCEALPQNSTLHVERPFCGQNSGGTMKPGYKTTEFWVTLLVNLAAIGAAFGVLSGEQAQALTEAAPQLAVVIVLILAGAAVGIRYIGSRQALKVAQ